MSLRMMTVAENEARIQNENDLVFWCKAYETALSGMCSGGVIVDPVVVSPVIARLADAALADYRAKRREMGI